MQKARRIFMNNLADEIALNNMLTIKIGKELISVSNLELQIAFKEIVLKSPKDMEDARHLRNNGKGHLDEMLLQKYERMLNDFYR
mgnify:CR=1 FL=1